MTFRIQQLKSSRDCVTADGDDDDITLFQDGRMYVVARIHKLIDINITDRLSRRIN